MPLLLNDGKPKIRLPLFTPIHTIHQSSSSSFEVQLLLAADPSTVKIAHLHNVLHMGILAQVSRNPLTVLRTHNHSRSDARSPDDTPRVSTTALARHLDAHTPSTTQRQSPRPLSLVTSLHSLHRRSPRVTPTPCSQPSRHGPLRRPLRHCRSRTSPQIYVARFVCLCNSCCSKACGNGMVSSSQRPLRAT